MANLIINGGKKLSGTITPSGNKNSVLPLLCASLLTDEEVTIKNVPELTDVKLLVESLKSVGSKVEWDQKSSSIKINNSKISASFFKNDFPLDMRGSILLFAPLLHRMKKLTIKNKIGGCSLGIREIDPHLEILRNFGAKIKNGSQISLEIKGLFRAANVWLDYMSVTATENFIMAAVLAKGTSSITNAASEPHVQDLCLFLNQAGAKISGIGTSTLEIEGVKKLKGTSFEVSSDHHEIATLLALGAMTGGEVRVKDVPTEHFPLIITSFAKLGVEIKKEKNDLIVKEKQELKVKPTYTKNMLQKIEGAPWPYFPVDLLPLMIALATKAKGVIMFWNKVYEGGFFWVPEMIKFGAHIVVSDPHRIIVFGNKPMKPAEADAPDVIRATVALAMVALAIKGESVIKNADPILRAHPNFTYKIKSLGADIRWEAEQE
ncbi:MAG: UDP-N-acetylglucosamine 1-carboxyvinyltransferase [Patescibacteria group bacterium]